MASSLSVAAYFARLGKAFEVNPQIEFPDRPAGAIIWVRCSSVEQLTAIETLHRRLTEDGDPYQVLITLADWDPSVVDRALAEPKGPRNIRQFLDHWQPNLAIWVQGNLDPVLLNAMHEAQLPVMLVDATEEGLDTVAGRWVPGAMRALLSKFEVVLTLNQSAAEGLIRAGAPQEVVRVTGPMEDCDPPLPCDETIRQEVTSVIGTRPVWLAASVPQSECDHLSQAHLIAGSRAHRLLLVVVPQDMNEAAAIALELRGKGLDVSLRSQEAAPDEVTQVYVIDTDEGLGLWYRVAPITYLGGTLTGGNCSDPFAPAALGSAVIYGPMVAPFQKHAARLNAAGASYLMRSGDDLGSFIETLLASDQAAALAHAAWDVTSRGADVTNRIVQIIQRRLEILGL